MSSVTPHDASALLPARDPCLHASAATYDTAMLQSYPVPPPPPARL